jgi:AraC-like DNA-binding protein/mannose-6-phosphate isomerase-like protein (cupin superfamily)
MRITNQQINRIYAEKNQRDASFFMSSHHFHPYYELYYLNHGTCRFFINNTFYTVEEGDLIVIPMHLFHYTKYSRPCTRTAVFFRAEDLKQIDQAIDFAHTYNELKIYHIPDASRRRIEEVLEHMLATMRYKDTDAPIALLVQLQELFLLIKRYGCLSDHMEELHTNDQEIVHAAQFISAHYAEHITTKDIAATTGFTPNYLSAKFHETAGICMHEYLVFVRLHHAENILMTSDLSITEIALQCGFSDSNYFKDAFKKMYGESPRNYRKKSK